MHGTSEHSEHIPPAFSLISRGCSPSHAVLELPRLFSFEMRACVDTLVPCVRGHYAAVVRPLCVARFAVAACWVQVKQTARHLFSFSGFDAPCLFYYKNTNPNFVAW